MFMIGELDLDFGNLTTQQNEDGTIGYTGSTDDLDSAAMLIQKELDRNIALRNAGWDAYEEVMGYPYGTGLLAGPPTFSDEDMARVAMYKNKDWAPDDTINMEAWNAYDPDSPYSVINGGDDGDDVGTVDDVDWKEG